MEKTLPYLALTNFNLHLLQPSFAAPPTFPGSSPPPGAPAPATGFPALLCRVSPSAHTELGFGPRGPGGRRLTFRLSTTSFFFF